MNAQMSASPLRYSPTVEKPAPDEAETIRGLVETLHGISETTLKDYGHAVRSVHAKSHGILKGKLRVLDGLPEMLAQGLFAQPKTYPVAIRFSTSPGDILPDTVSTPRGVGIKVIDVDGERLAGTEDAATQDFVLVNGPAFLTPDPKGFLKNLKLLAGTTDKAEGLKVALSAVLRGTESVLETFGGESGTLKSLGGHPETNILGETFFSQVPIRYGNYIAKISVAPVSPELAALKDASVDLSDNPDGLRQAVIDFFSRNGGEWEVRVQLCTDLETMPVEDASVVWPEDKSPYITVARITVPPQDAWTETNRKETDEGMAFSPWHCLAAHQPLGGIMRARKPSYEMSAGFRSQNNGCPIHEPRKRMSAAE